MKVCVAFTPGGRPVDGMPSCRACGVPMDRHGPFADVEPSLYEVCVRIQRLLTHYGHDCTVQGLLPELTRAMAREYGR